MYPEISEAQRFPLLTEAGRKLLHAMREDPQAPLWNWPNGEQLDAAGLQRVQQFAKALAMQSVSRPDRLPPWLPGLVDYCLEDVPFYRGRSRPGTPFHSIASCNRADLAAGVWRFVPDSQPLDQLIVFSSSGTTGHPAKLPTHPFTAACGIPLLEHALAPLGLRFPRGPQSRALTSVVAYGGAYTTATVISYLNEAGYVRVNLHADDWRLPGDCADYLNRWQAPVILGDPLAFAELSRIPLNQPPQLLISCILELSDAFAGQLQSRLGCPVLDLYALTEAGIVAVKTPWGHVVLPHDLYVEILDEHDEPCPLGSRGEVTLSGGRNPLAPLLRYRTGDFASLQWHQGRPHLVGLQGRQGAVFLTAADRVIHSMEVSRRLRPFPLVQYTFHQAADRSFHFGYMGQLDVDAVRAALLDLLGHSASLEMEPLGAAADGPRKRQVFQSAVPGSEFAADFRVRKAAEPFRPFSDNT